VAARLDLTPNAVYALTFRARQALLRDRRRGGPRGSRENSPAPKVEPSLRGRS
jgi:hypothetical protein